MLTLLKVPRGEAEHLLRHARKRRPFSDSVVRAFFESVEAADSLSLSDCPYPEDVRFMDDRQTQRYARLRERLLAVCGEAKVSTSLVARAAHLRLLACGSRRSFPFLRGWRYDFFGKAALVLAGRG